MAEPSPSVNDAKNSDTFLHNIHTLSEKNPSFNKAQPNKNDGEKVEAPGELVLVYGTSFLAEPDNKIDIAQNLTDAIDFTPVF
jgi:hypothetical protein